LNSKVKGELEFSLLRMAENRVVAEMKIEELQAELDKKDRIIDEYKQKMMYADNENKKLKERIQLLENSGIKQIMPISKFDGGQSSIQK
jgi:hypothetical protein